MTTDKLTRDLRAVVTDAEDLIKATAGRAGERVEKARARAEESLHLARASLQDAGSQLNEQVRQNPWTAIGVDEEYRALAAGVIALAFLALAAAAWGLRDLTRARPRAFDASLTELERDYNALRP